MNVGHEVLRDYYSKWQRAGNRNACDELIRLYRCESRLRWIESRWWYRLLLWVYRVLRRIA